MTLKHNLSWLEDDLLDTLKMMDIDDDERLTLEFNINRAFTVVREELEQRKRPCGKDRYWIEIDEVLGT